MQKRITSFEEACQELGLDPNKILPDVTNVPDTDQKGITAFAKMCIINRVLNGQWKPDWSDWNQPKYYPWLKASENKDSSSGFALSYYAYDCDSTYAFVGVRLYYKDRETARYAGETFIGLYEDMILLPK